MITTKQAKNNNNNNNTRKPAQPLRDHNQTIIV